MASFRKRNGLWQEQVRSIHAGATSKSFHRKSDAERWATQQEALMLPPLLSSQSTFTRTLPPPSPRGLIIHIVPRACYRGCGDRWG